jgi:hypothetical protein
MHVFIFFTSYVWKVSRSKKNFFFVMFLRRRYLKRQAEGNAHVLTRQSLAHECKKK